MRKLLPLFLGGLALSLVLFSCKDSTSDTPADEPVPVLSGLSLSTGTLNPAFAADTTSYSAAVANSVNP